MCSIRPLISLLLCLCFLPRFTLHFRSNSSSRCLFVNPYFPTRPCLSSVQYRDLCPLLYRQLYSFFHLRLSLHGARDSAIAFLRPGSRRPWQRTLISHNIISNRFRLKTTSYSFLYLAAIGVRGSVESIGHLPEGLPPRSHHQHRPNVVRMSLPLPNWAHLY